MSSSATTCYMTQGHELDGLQQQLQNMNFQAKPTQTSTPSRTPHHPPPTPTNANPRLDHFRITLYLSLIPQHLIPKHLFTLDPRTGYILRKSTDRTVQFLNHLEELWEAADFCEEIVLESLVRSVSGRQRRWGGGEGELTIADLQMAREMVRVGSAGGWSPVSETPSSSSSSTTNSNDNL